MHINSFNVVLKVLVKTISQRGEGRRRKRRVEREWEGGEERKERKKRHTVWKKRSKIIFFL